MIDKTQLNAMSEEERDKAIALLASLGINLNEKPKKTPKEKKEKAKRVYKHYAKPYNLRLTHHCRLCGAEWNEDSMMLPAMDDPSILVSNEPPEDELFYPDVIEDRFPRSCMFCKARLANLSKEQIILATVVLSNRVLDASMVRHIESEEIESEETYE